MTSTVGFFAFLRTKKTIFACIATIWIVYLISYKVAMSDQQSQSMFFYKLFKSKFWNVRYFTSEQSNASESMEAHLSTAETVGPRISTSLFEVGASKEHDLVQRTLAQLNLMNEYGATYRTLNRTVKVILRVGGFNWEDWVEGDQKFVQNKCPVKECFLTSDTDGKKHTADVLLISKIDSNSVKAYLPKPAHQIWIVRHMESPLHNRVDPSSLKGLVNWTFTYRVESSYSVAYYPQFLPTASIDSQFHFKDKPYFMRIPQPPGASYSTINYAHGKHKKVAWFVSNCGGRNGRNEYAAELARYINVDIFGGCGKHSCVKENNGCRRMLSDDYKFYLAFENSNCVGYITEKPGFQALLSDVVPIVMGARPEDYKSLLPPNSYIHVDDFRGPEHLAEYLNVIDKNDTLYNSYFQWKDSWTAVDDNYNGYWCRMCFLLHYRDDINYVHSYADYTEWWNGACTASQSENGRWQTWRPIGFWVEVNATNLHRV